MSNVQQLIAKGRKAIRIGPALRLVWKASPKWTTAHIILIVVQGLLPIVLLYLTKLVIDTITANFSGNVASHQHYLFMLLGLMGLVSLFSSWVSVISEYVSEAQARQVTDAMANVLHAKSIEVDLEYYESPEYQNTLQRAQAEAVYRPNQILYNLVDLGQNSISLIAMLGLLLSLHWGIAGVLFVAAIPAVLVKLKYADVRYKWDRKRTETERQTDYLSWLLTNNLFAKEIRLFNLGNLFSQRFSNLRRVLYRENLFDHCPTNPCQPSCPISGNGTDLFGLCLYRLPHLPGCFADWRSGDLSRSAQTRPKCPKRIDGSTLDPVSRQPFPD